MRDLKETIQKLKEREKRADKKGYGGDATDHAFKRHVLILLAEIAKKPKRKPTEYQKRVGKFLKDGYSLEHSHHLAKLKEEKE